MTFYRTMPCKVLACEPWMVDERGYKDEKGNAVVVRKQDGWLLVTDQGFSIRLQSNPNLKRGDQLEFTIKSPGPEHAVPSNVPGE